MFRSLEDRMSFMLAQREASDMLRSLPAENDLLDFCSNDYSGLARTKVNPSTPLGAGSTGSRLISGNTRYFEAVEEKIAAFHHAESALVFSSGYLANVGLVSSVSDRHDTIIYDELIHASMRDGARLSLAESYSFRHNNVKDLARKLRNCEGNVIVLVEAVYSMDGDQSPLEEIAEVCQTYNARLIVDEAHSNGLFGPNGEGLVYALGLQDKVFARVMTFGKALGRSGAAVVGSKLLHDYLLNFCRPFIFTTAISADELFQIESVYQDLPKQHEKRDALFKLVHQFTSAFEGNPALIKASGPIQCILTPGNSQAKMVAKKLREAGFDIKAILSPTVKSGQERIRICLHAYNTTEQIDQLLVALKEILPS